MWSELLLPVGFFVVWIVLMRFVLPALGVPTCMSGSCTIKKREERDVKREEE